MGELRVSHRISPGPAAIPRVRVSGILPSWDEVTWVSSECAGATVRGPPMEIGKRHVEAERGRENGSEEEEEGVKFGIEEG